jgi:AraC-like DNA-binding protein
MLSQTFIPSPALRLVARSYHIRHFVFPSKSNSIKPYPARPEQSILFFPRQAETVEYVNDNKRIVRPRAMIMNQYTVRTNRHISDDFLVIIVELQPGILNRLAGMPLQHVTNTDIDAEAFLPNEIKLVAERLSGAADYATMIAIVEKFVLQLARQLKGHEHAVDRIAQHLMVGHYNASLDWLANQANLSARQLERKFKERMGVGAKTFARLVRLHESYKLKSYRPATDWLDIALSCGYYDYQHLSKDYHEFAGCSPNKLFVAQQESPESVMGLTETFA